jgi:hypothetical protein
MNSIYKDDDVVVVYEPITDDDIILVYLGLLAIIFCFVRYHLLEEDRRQSR